MLENAKTQNNIEEYIFRTQGFIRDKIECQISIKDSEKSII